MLKVEQQGRRHYFMGDTYAIKDRLRDAGAHWDGDRRAWWIGSAAKASEIVSQLAAAPASTAASSSGPGDRTYVSARATYKGKPAYVAGRVERGRTHHEDRVLPVTSRDGSKILLYSLDGERQWWAQREEVTFTRHYERPQTIDGLKRYAESMRNAPVTVNGHGVASGDGICAMCSRRVRGGQSHDCSED